MTRARDIAPPSRLLLAAAQPYLGRFLARHFSGLRIAADGQAPRLTGPTIFYSNHPSWWDPIVLFLLLRTHYADWRIHGPIDQRALARYRSLERLGLFGVEPDTAAGARRFLSVAETVLSLDRGGIAMTAQGEFTDSRQRPVRLKRGLSSLLRRVPAATAIPIAIDYVFWDERLPEVLVRFGRAGTTADGRTADSIHAELEDRLETELDALSEQGQARDPEAFSSLIVGKRGVGLLQDLPLRLRSLFRGEKFDPSHSAIGRDSG